MKYYLMVAVVMPFLIYQIFKCVANPLQFAYVTLEIKILLDTPICKLQNLGFLEMKRAHFSPKYGETIDKYRCRPTLNKKIINEYLKSDLIVASDFGGVVERIDKDGQVKWRALFTTPRGISRDGLSVFVCDQDRLHVLSIEDGSVLRSYKLPFLISKLRVEDNMFWVLTNEKNSSIIIYKEKNGQLEKTRVLNNVGQYARDFEFDTEYIYVADTFNHKVSKYFKATGGLVSSLDSFYPNSINILGGQTVLVAEEHNNAIANFNFEKMSRTVVRSCETGFGIESLNDLRVVANKSIVSDKESPCRVLKGNYLVENIFSPNDAINTDDGMYVADTDNHRIVYFDKFRNKTNFIYDFNSPVGVLVLK